MSKWHEKQHNISRLFPIKILWNSHFLSDLQLDNVSWLAKEKSIFFTNTRTFIVSLSGWISFPTGVKLCLCIRCIFVKLLEKTFEVIIILSYRSSYFNLFSVSVSVCIYAVMVSDQMRTPACIASSLSVHNIHVRVHVQLIQTK